MASDAFVGSPMVGRPRSRSLYYADICRQELSTSCRSTVQAPASPSLQRSALGKTLTSLALPPQAAPYRNERAVLATRHGKLECIGPPLEADIEAAVIAWRCGLIRRARPC